MNRNPSFPQQSLEDEGLIEVKWSDAEDYFSASGHLLVLDEIQRKPDLFPILRRVIDAQKRKGQRAGQFLLLGSASPDAVA